MNFEKVGRPDPFYTVDLVVKGMRDVHESLHHFTRAEVLETAIDADEFGRQKARQKVKFGKLPPVMVFSLLRTSSGRSIDDKCTDHLMFPEVLILDPYMQQKPDKPALYNLHAVLVHSGEGGKGGHYWNYVKLADGDWMCFNDEEVSRAAQKEAIDDRFGGTACAYGIIYVREGDCWKENSRARLEAPTMKKHSRTLFSI